MKSTLCTSLELHLCSESKNDCALRSASHIRVVLNDWLQKEHRQRVQQGVEFNAVLPLPCRRARRKELLAEAVLHVAERHGVVKRSGNGSLKRSPAVSIVLLRLMSAGLQS